MRDIGRLFDQARDSPDGFEAYATQFGEAFADNRGMLEDVLAALFVIARADGAVNGREQTSSSDASCFRLDQTAWDRVRGVRTRRPVSDEPDAYAISAFARHQRRGDPAPGSG